MSKVDFNFCFFCDNLDYVLHAIPYMLFKREKGIHHSTEKHGVLWCCKDCAADYWDRNIKADIFSKECFIYPTSYKKIKYVEYHLNKWKMAKFPLEKILEMEEYREKLNSKNPHTGAGMNLSPLEEFL